jgi:hypothetical protein
VEARFEENEAGDEGGVGEFVLFGDGVDEDE